MGKAYFSLIHEGKLTTAPHTKIIKADAFSDLLTSKELLETVTKDAEEYRREVAAECENLKVQAQKEGFEVGYQAWAKQLAQLEQEIAKVHQELQKIVLPIALKAAKKIVSAELETSPQAILSIVMGTIKSVAQHKKVIIYVNKADFEAIESNKGKIKELFEAVESLSIRERDDVEQGGCVIETEIGIINAQLKDRWVTLEAAFQALGEQLRNRA